MAQATVNSGQDLSINDVKLDDLSLDDDALFADLDNEVRLEGAVDDNASLETTDDLNLDFDVEAVASTGGKAPAKSGNGSGAAGSSRERSERGSTAGDLNLGLDDTQLGDVDFDLNLDDISGPAGGLKLDSGEAPAGNLEAGLGAGGAGELNLDLEGPAPTQAAGAGELGGDILDLDISDATAGGLDLHLDKASAPAPAAVGETLDLDFSEEGPGGDELNLDLEAPRGPATGLGIGETLDLDISDATLSSGAGDESMDLDAGAGATEALPGAAEDIDLSLDLDQAALPAVAGEDLDMNLDLEEPAAATASVPAPGLEVETIDLDLGGEAIPIEEASGAGMPSAEAEPALEAEDLSRPKGAEQLEEVVLAEEAPMPATPSGAEEPLLDTDALPAATGAPEESAGEFQAVPDVDLDSVNLELDQAVSEFIAAPDVDLNAVDLSLDMPFAETHGDAGAPVVPPSEMAAPPPPTGMRLFPGMGTGAGGRLEGAPEELLELNLADLESKAEAPGERGPAAPAAWQAPAARPPVVGQPTELPAAVPAAEGSLVSSVLLSLPHQVQVRMGTVSMLGQDLMNLSHGSVVPLHRAVGEPVDLILDGKTIAQGEIVVINGRNLGVRIVTLSK